MLQTILLVAMILISIALTAMVLLQRSEGGALGMGGGPSGFMTARGAGNLLSTTTWWLAAGFFICALLLTIVGNMDRASTSVVDADAVGAIAVGSDAPAAGQAPAEATPAEKAAPSLSDLEESLAAPAATPPAQQPAPVPAPAQ